MPSGTKLKAKDMVRQELRRMAVSDPDAVIASLLHDPSRLT